MALISPNLHSIRAAINNAGGVPPPPTMTVREVGQWHIDLQWTYDGGAWDDPCILQRKTSGSFPTPNLANAQDVETNFIWIGIREADRYVDLGLTPGMLYEYRACYVTNYSAVLRDGDPATYSDWQYGSATTTSRAPTVYNLVAHGGDNTGVSNSWSAFEAIIEDIKTGGGTEAYDSNVVLAIDSNGDSAVDVGGGTEFDIYAPAGTYLIYPEGDDVVWDGSWLSVVNGQSHITTLFNGELSNIRLYGDVDGSGTPTTNFNCRLWHNRSGQEWLTVLKTAGGDPSNDNDIYAGSSGTAYRNGIKRWTFWNVAALEENVKIENLNIDMTAIPVSTGKRPGAWGFDALRYEWDESHKLVSGFNGGRNIHLKNIHCENTRGEGIFLGGNKFEKVKLEDSSFKYLNSSAISMSANLEMENVTTSDTANAGMEMNNHSRAGFGFDPVLTSDISGLQYWHDMIIRDCTFVALDQTGSGVMKDLADLETADNAFAGLYLFNQTETFQSVTDCTIQDFRLGALAPWYECENVFYANLAIDNPVAENCKVIYLSPGQKTSYQLDGGMDYVYFGNIDITLGSTDITNSGGIFRSATNLDCQENFIMDKVTLDGNSQKVNVLWIDLYNNSDGRGVGFKCRDWTASSFTSDSNSNLLVNLNSSPGTLPPPFYEDFDFGWHRQTVGVITPVLGQNEIHGSGTITDINNINKLPIGSTMKFKSSSGTQTWAPDVNWNNFSTLYSVSGSDVLTCLVVDSGTPKLSYVSLA